MRSRKGTNRGISTAIDCNSRYCWLDPEVGAKHAVAEASRNVVCTGAKPLMTNCP
ncbi:MAG: AIR synthase related protein [Thermomicrobiales bacterium]